MLERSFFVIQIFGFLGMKTPISNLPQPTLSETKYSFVRVVTAAVRVMGLVWPASYWNADADEPRQLPLHTMGIWDDIPAFPNAEQVLFALGPSSTKFKSFVCAQKKLSLDSTEANIETYMGSIETITKNPIDLDFDKDVEKALEELKETGEVMETPPVVANTLIKFSKRNPTSTTNWRNCHAFYCEHEVLIDRLWKHVNPEFSKQSFSYHQATHSAHGMYSSDREIKACQRLQTNGWKRLIGIEID
eukprot:Protomagalhaensia_wolfi_Nauph_80__2018@NODE_2280_length_1141_cov_30_233212_g1564_i1_p1_GENE_NODE_2280_length_1141_cov_30_233212_g1564_i1NODE_2280_length_1141_cov_30_233212_g1564_i1_p1_ORF_typecomplete_len247_score48_00_NODE_2280_length_1141_cov_30_233212_g1564_i170810